MIPELSSLIRSSIAETLEDRIAVAFSGGVDSTVIAQVAKRDAEVELFSAGMEGCPDLEFSEKAAGLMGLPLERILMEKEDILEAFEKCYSVAPNELLKVEILVPVWAAAKRAADKGHSVLFFGAAAEELFVGYERYFVFRDDGGDLEKLLKDEFKGLAQREISWISKICRKHGLEARFPLYNRKLADFMHSIPLDERMGGRELKKPILREAAKMLGVPDIVLKRRKQAMQYGSGIHKVIMKNADELNRKFPAPQKGI
ncbi:MAG: asparagine synthase C-terminal domain-containing protein [Candidatus Micrarchaeota archaeon]